MAHPRRKTRALLAIAAGATTAIVACSSSMEGVVALPSDAGEDALEPCQAPNFCGLVGVSPDAAADAQLGCDACGIIATSPDASADAGEPDALARDAASDASEPSDAHDDAGDS